MTVLLNTGQWVFAGVDGRYTIGLVTVSKGMEPAPVVRLRGPYASHDAYALGVAEPGLEFPAAEFRTWATGGAFPLLPTVAAGEVFRQMRTRPRLDSAAHNWRARPVQGDFNATTDRGQFVAHPGTAAGLWPVLSGAAFNLWKPETGEIFGWADPEQVVNVLQEKRVNQQRRASSAFAEFSREWAADRATLPCRHPRIAFRDVTNRTNTRTVIPVMLPGEVIATNAAPFFVWPRGGARDQAYLLGILSSIPLDWYARCVVELHVNFHLLNGFPIPNPPPGDERRRRVEEISGLLAAIDDRFATWAEAVGVPVGSAGKVKPDLIAELDAIVAHLYGLTREHVEHVFATFHRGWDYADRLSQVLAHFDRWAGNQ